MIDLNSRSGLSDRLNWLIDEGIDASVETPRTYLGCSAIGGECERSVQLEYVAYAVNRDAGREARCTASACPFPARVRRIFERGHDVEDRAARWLRLARLLLVTEDPLTGGQFEVSFLGGRLLGHADGILTCWRGEGDAPLPLPALWECKCLAHKYVTAARREHIRRSHPKYWYQMQLYMMGLHLERGLITCVDADTMELYHELVPYDEGEAVKRLQRATRIFQATDAGELLPRAESTPAAVACRMCRVAKVCWGA